MTVVSCRKALPEWVTIRFLRHDHTFHIASHWEQRGRHCFDISLSVRCSHTLHTPKGALWYQDSSTVIHEDPRRERSTPLKRYPLDGDILSTKNGQVVVLVLTVVNALEYHFSITPRHFLYQQISGTGYNSGCLTMYIRPWPYQQAEVRDGCAIACQSISQCSAGLDR